MPRCICEICKRERETKRRARAEKREAAVQRRIAQAGLVAAETIMDQAREIRRLQEKLARHGAIRDVNLTRAEWTCGDGRRIRVIDMDDAHLFFALAKGFRNEYPDSVTRRDGVRALKAEALFRLQNRVV